MLQRTSSVILKISAFLTVVFSLLVCAPQTKAENLPEEKHIPYRHIIYPPELPDTADLRLYTKKHFWRGAAETVGINLGIWAFDRYALKGYYAYISWKTIKNNLKKGFVWDDDHLHENMFGHPYHGSLYYNSGRSNGYNFWQSGLFALGGSAMWEIAMENVPPSLNDIIATPVGGMAIGEVLYRTSDMIIDDSSTGGERFGRELGAFIVDPIRGFNRIITGQAWKKRATTGRRFGMPPVSIEVGLGARYLYHHTSNYQRLRGGVGAKVELEYGYRYEGSKTPYDYFSVLGELQVVKTQPIVSRVKILGRIISRHVVDKPKFNLNVGLYQHFDYFDSDSIKAVDNDIHFSDIVPYKMASPASVGIGGMFRYAPARKMYLDGQLHANALILAGIESNIFRKYHRDYNWGQGFSLQGALNWSVDNDRLSIRLADQLYGVYTWKNYDHNKDWTVIPDNVPAGVMGAKSDAYFNHFESSVNLKLFKQWYLSAGVDLYTRISEYTRCDLTAGQSDASFHDHSFKSRQIGYNLRLVHKF